MGGYPPGRFVCGRGCLCMVLSSGVQSSSKMSGWSLLFTNIKYPNIIFCRNLFSNSRILCENRDEHNDMTELRGVFLQYFSVKWPTKCPL